MGTFGLGEGSGIIVQKCSQIAVKTKTFTFSRLMKLLSFQKSSFETSLILFTLIDNPVKSETYKRKSYCPLKKLLERRYP